MSVQITIPTPNIKLPKLPKFRKPGRKIRLLATLAVLVVIGACSWFIYQRTLTGPAIGVIITSMQSAERKPQVDLEQFDGKNFSFVHPVTFIEQQQSKTQPVTNDIEHHIFLTTGMTGEYLTIIITKFDGSSLADNPSYSMRYQNEKKYPRKVVVVKNEQVPEFTSNDAQQLEQSAFWLHAGKLMTFTLTGMAGDSQASTAEFTAMVQSITWH